jgi:beta-phosphoglucomutase
LGKITELSLHSSLLPAAVIFDCDGVLVDTEPLHYRAFQEALRPLGLGHDYEHYLEHFIGYDDRDAFLQVFAEAGRRIDSAVLTDLIDTKHEVLLRLASASIRSFPGVPDLVDELVSAGVALAVASGSLRSEVTAFIGALGIENVFSVVVSADDVTKSKPDPETYLRALDGLKKARGGVDWDDEDIKRIIAIEDTPAGILSAKAAGIRVVGVAHSRPAGELAEACLVVENMTQLNLSKLIRLMDAPSS